MSAVWHENAPGVWTTRALPLGKLLVGEDVGASGLGFLALPQGSERGALLFSCPSTWVRVNGLPVLGGLRLLEHRDEILTEGGRLYFSRESAPRVVAYQISEGGRAAICPVCRGPLKEGAEAVQCPGCARWFHEGRAGGGIAKPCWTYAPQCRFCGHPTPLDAGSAWHPAKEDARAR